MTFPREFNEGELGQGQTSISQALHKFVPAKELKDFKRSAVALNLLSTTVLSTLDDEVTAEVLPHIMTT